MPKKKKETAMIYESPDGGATVYALSLIHI